LPPGFDGDVPDGYFPLRFETFNGYGLLRAIPTTTSEPDVEKAIGLVKQLHLYPLATAYDSPVSRHIDMVGKLLDGVVQFNASFFERLARMVDEEPVRTRDLMMMGQLRTLGMVKGQPFEPDEETRQILSEAAEEAHQGFMRALHGGEGWWQESHWKLREDKGSRTGFSFQDENGLYTTSAA
jgi:hypothetical protein